METKNKPLCEYGTKCYRKNPRHFEMYSHPEKKDNIEEAVQIRESEDESNVKIKISKKSKIKQTKLSFPKKCEFSSPLTTQTVDIKKESPMIFKCESDLVKNDVNESMPLKRKRKNSCSKKKRPKVKAPNFRNKTSSCFKCNDSSRETFESSDISSHDCNAVQSTSWIYVKNQLSERDTISDKIELKSETKEELIKSLFLVNMPSDFYSFYEFCKSLNENCPEKALEVCELKLVGPFDILSGKINNPAGKDSFLCHWRFYYDPPEFQTVLATASGLHFGYWRDNPKENPVFLASNNSDKDCVFKVAAENIFGTVHHYLNEFLKNCDPFKKMEVKKLKDYLSDWVNKTKFTLETKTGKMSERQKKIVTKSFHRAGIVVPVHPTTEVGYRPLIETDANLRKICELIMKANDESEREALWENLQPLITAANIANDECDFGNSLELGIDLFCMGSSVFHGTVEYLLSTAYSLLNRTEFEQIIKAHLKLRRKGNCLSIFE